MSCDEAVIRLFGESTRSSYAMAIIHMAEVKSGITPLCSNFSKNAIEERIVAIMKFKKSSFIALALDCALVLTVGATFATSANATEASNTGEKVESIVSDEVILSRTNDDGKIQYSADGGKTFLDEDDFQKRYQTVNVEWWTYEEYKAWLENEKEVLQGMLGEKAYTNNRGDFIWTQEVIDETIAEYEKTLQDIKSGIKISKTVDGNEDIMLAQYDDNNAVFGTKKEGANEFRCAPFSLAAEGVIPWKQVKALPKLSGASYPYFRATSITRASVDASSSAASVSLRFRIYSPTVNSHNT